VNATETTRSNGSNRYRRHSSPKSLDEIRISDEFGDELTATPLDPQRRS